MNKTLLLALVAALFVVGDLSAQSGSKRSNSGSSNGGASYSRGGSSSKNAAAMKKKMERLEAKQIGKIARQIQKDNFAGITLNKSQKTELKELVTDNFKSLVQFDSQIQSFIPADSVKQLQRTYTASKKKGSNKTEAMMMSMKKVGLSETVQNKVMQASSGREELVQEIVAGVSELLDEDQKKTLMAKTEEKAKMMKEKMSGKEMTDKDKEDMKAEVTVRN